MIDIQALRAHFAAMPDYTGDCAKLNDQFMGDWVGYQKTLAHLVGEYFRFKMVKIFEEFKEHPGILKYEDESKPIAEGIMIRHWPCDLITFRDIMALIPDEYVFHYTIYGMKMIEGARLITEHMIFENDEPLKRLEENYNKYQADKANVH